LNEFVTGDAAGTTADKRITRALTVELNYEKYCGRKAAEEDKNPSFSQVLEDALGKETRLRAWCAATKSYETIIQRRRASNLPNLLTVSCACAGNDDGINLWKGGGFLPEKIKIVIRKSGRVAVTEAGGVEANPKANDDAYQSIKYELISVVSHVVNKEGSIPNKKEVSERSEAKRSEPRGRRAYEPVSEAS